MCYIYTVVTIIYLLSKCWRFCSAVELKKFYQSAHITQVAGKPGYFEVNLDQRKLKTPLGTVLEVPGQPLALAIATEWNSQKDVIKRHSMHIVCGEF